MYEIIRTFSPIFRSLNFESPRAAATYYVNLIINFPTNLQSILNEAQTFYGNEINRQSLYAGRQELLKNGIIARTYFTKDDDVDFDREMYLPVSPKTIWKEIKDKTAIYWNNPEEIAFRENKVNELQKYYLHNFKKFGLGIEKGSITILCDINWFARSLINIFDLTKSIDAMLNALELFIIPDYFEYYEKAFARGMTQRALYDMNIKRRILNDEESLFKENISVIEQRKARLDKLRRDYENQITIRYTPMFYTTARNVIFYNEDGPYLASDFRRLLSIDQGEPSYYIGTFYLQKDLISHIKEIFEAQWKHGIDLEIE